LISNPLISNSSDSFQREKSGSLDKKLPPFVRCRY
jgi:hypothetical protein